jgi:hypothetical protein
MPGIHGCQRRSRFFQIARRSALECAALDDILLSFQAIGFEAIRYRRKQSSTSTSTVSLSTSRRRKRTRKYIGPNVLLSYVHFSPCPLEPLFSLLPLFYLLREWKETPSDATSFLRRIGFIGPNAPFS